MSFLSALPIIGDVVGGILGADGSQDASNAMELGRQKALKESNSRFDGSALANMLLNMPTINTGNTARSQLASLLGLNVRGTSPQRLANMPGFSELPEGVQSALLSIQSPDATAERGDMLRNRLESTPGFQFARDQAMKGIQGNSRALGLGQSGASIQAIGDTVGQGLALPVYDSYLAQLGALAGQGTNTSTNAANANTNIQANAAGINTGLMTEQADARASGILGRAQSNIDTVSNVFGADWAGVFGK